MNSIEFDVVVVANVAFLNDAEVRELLQNLLMRQDSSGFPWRNRARYLLDELEKDPSKWDQAIKVVRQVTIARGLI